MPYAWRGANTRLVLRAPVASGPQQAAQTGTAAVGLGGQGTGKKVAAVNGRCALGLGGAAGSARQAAQTGRGVLGMAGWSTPDAPAPAGTFTHITVTRDYDLATGAAPTGTVYFTPSGWLRNNTVTLVAAPVGAPLDSIGRVSLSLAANTDPATVPPGSYYTVREEIVGQPDRTYKVAIPHNAGPTVDLSTLPVIG